MKNSEQFKLLPLHKNPTLYDACENLLQSYWPMSATYRKYLIGNSCDEFPTNLAFVDMFKDPPEVIGHIRLKRVYNDPFSLMIYSVIIKADRRGQGLGFELMKQAEYFARDKGFLSFYLSTQDKVGFYEKCGYTRCDPVLSYNKVSSVQDIIAKFNKKQINDDLDKKQNLNLVANVKEIFMSKNI